MISRKPYQGLFDDERVYMEKLEQRFAELPGRLRLLLGGDGFQLLQYRGNAMRPHTSYVVSFGTHTMARAGRWLHASIAHPTFMPSYDELKQLAQIAFVDRYCYQVFVPQSAIDSGNDQHVNIHPFCLHLWGYWEADGAGEVLPAFGRHGTI